MSDGLDQGDTGQAGPVADEGVSAREAGKALSQSWQRHPNEDVDKYLRGDALDDVGTRAKQFGLLPESKDPDKGLSARQTADALNKYRASRQTQVQSELATNFGIAPDGSPLTPERADPQSEQHQPGAGHPEVAAAQHAHAQAQAQAAEVALAHAQLQIQSAMMARYGDIRTAEDVRVLAAVDPGRYQQMLADHDSCCTALGQQAAQHQQYAQAWADQQDSAF